MHVLDSSISSAPSARLSKLKQTVKLLYAIYGFRLFSICTQTILFSYLLWVVKLTVCVCDTTPRVKKTLRLQRLNKNIGLHVSQGSVDGNEWDTIKEHWSDLSLDKKSACRAWSLASNEFYSHFRILQTGANSNNHFVSSFEFAMFCDLPYLVGCYIRPIFMDGLVEPHRKFLSREKQVVEPEFTVLTFTWEIHKITEIRVLFSDHVCSKSNIESCSLNHQLLRRFVA